MKKIVSILIILSFLVTGQIGTCPVYAASFADGDFRLPAPGVMIHLSPEFNPPILKGIKVHPDNPFRFDFILDQGDDYQNSNVIKSEASRLIKYFLASLTIPEQDLWVNLSPYEKDRIVPQSFGLTEMGRDLLAEDYMLKQITASLIYPEDAVGKKFWKRIYQEAARKFGTTNIPVNTFNKVWIVPAKAVVYENAKSGTAYVVESKLKVMLEQDYLSLRKHTAVHNDMASVGANIVREIVIPELTREVNEDKNFSQLRQVYNSLILAAWYKNKIKDSILTQIYEDKRKIAGVGYKNSPTFDIEAIYQRYLQAFKKGVYNYIKEEQDPMTQQVIPRKYFSGGTTFSNAAMASALSFTTKDAAVLSQSAADREEVVEINLNSTPSVGNQAMNAAADSGSDRVQIWRTHNLEQARRINEYREMQIWQKHDEWKLTLDNLFLHLQSPLELDPSYKLVSGLALVESENIEYRRDGVAQLLAYAGAYHNPQAIDGLKKNPDIMLEMALESLGRINYKELGKQGIQAKEELRYWLENGRGTTAFAATLLGMSKSRFINMYSFYLGDQKVNELLAHQGIDYSEVYKQITAVEQGISYLRYNTWAIKPDGNQKTIDLSRYNWGNRMKAIRSMVEQRAFYGKGMGAAYIQNVIHRIGVLQRIPDFIKEKIEASGKLGDAKITSIYIGGSYLWGSDLEFPTLMDIYVLTNKDVSINMTIPIPKDIFNGDSQRRPGRMGIAIRGRSTFFSNDHNNERNKIITYGTSVLLDGEDVLQDSEPPSQNFLAYANSLAKNGREYLDLAEEYFNSVGKNGGIAHGVKEGTPVRQPKMAIHEEVGGSTKLPVPVNIEEALYYVRKAARRLVQAELVLQKLNPSLNVDPQELNDTFVDTHRGAVHFKGLQEAYALLDGRMAMPEGKVLKVNGHIQQTKAFLVRELQLQLLANDKADFAMAQTKLRRLPMDDDEIKTYFMAFRGYEAVPGHELYIPVHHFYKQENGLERWDNLSIPQVLALLGKEFVPASHNRREYIRDIEGSIPLVDARVVYTNMQTRFQFTWKPGKRNEWAEKQEQALQITSNVPPEVSTKISFIKEVTVKQGKNIFEINVNQAKKIEIKQFSFNGNENEPVASDHGIRSFSFGNDYRISYKQEPRFSFDITQKEDGEYSLTFKDVRADNGGSILTWTSLEAKPHFIYKGEYQMSGQANGYKKKNLELVNPSNGTMALISGFDGLPEGAAIEAAKSIGIHLLSWDFNSKTVTKNQVEKPAAIEISRFSAVYGRVASSMFYQADPNGPAILKDLIKKGDYEEVSSAEVRLKKIEGKPISRPQEIAGRNFDHIWSISQQPPLIKLPKLLDPYDKDSIWESGSTPNLVRLKRGMIIAPSDFPEIPENNEFWAILHEAQSRLDWKDVVEKLIQNGWAKYIDPSTDSMVTPSEIYLTADLVTEKEKMEEKLGKDFSRIYHILQQSDGIKSNREFRQFMELHSLSIEKDLDQYPSMEITLVAVWQDPRGHGWLAGVNIGNNRLNLKKRSGEIVLLSGGSLGKKRKGERPDIQKHIVSGEIIEPGDTVFATSGIGSLGRDFAFEGDSLRAMTRQLIHIPIQQGKKGFASVVALRVYPGKDVNDVNSAMAAQVVKGKRSENVRSGNKKYGGIDLTPANMHLQTNNTGSEIKFHIDPAMLKQLQNAPGFVPVIINVHPLKSLPEFLGLSQGSAGKPAL